MKKIIHMVTISKSISLMKGQLEYFQRKGYTVGLVSSPGEELNNSKVDFKKGIEMEREINILKDLKSLIKLIKYFKKEKPEILNTGTPKAGLLGIVASFIARVPNRIYTMRGLRLETTTGVKRKVLWITEKISCTLATEVICISPSLLSEAKKLKLLKNKGVVLNRGSSNGLDLTNYPLPKEEKVQKFVHQFFTNNSITENNFILGFVGRLTKDKGIDELIEVFLDLNNNNIKLIILGDFEKELSNKIKSIIYNHEDIYYLGSVADPTLYYYLFDVLIFPTHREGFGNVSIEAQAASIPVITTDATGAKDTVLNSQTGLIYPIKDKEKLKSSILFFYNNEIKKHSYGKLGRSFIAENFQSEIIWKELEEIYKNTYK